MFLIIFVKLGGTFDTKTAALSIGFGLALLVYIFGYISGAHLNPNVSIAILCQKQPTFSLRKDRGMVFLYFVSQILGAIAGGFLSWAVGGNAVAAAYPTVPGDDIMSLLSAMIAEFIFTFLLCTVVLHVAVDPRTQPNHYYGLCIGIALTLGITCIGPISGCCLNTAVWIGNVVPAALTGQIKRYFKDGWVYWLATTLGMGISDGYAFFVIHCFQVICLYVHSKGGLMAGMWFKLIHAPKVQNSERSPLLINESQV